MIEENKEWKPVPLPPGFSIGSIEVGRGTVAGEKVGKDCLRKADPGMRLERPTALGEGGAWVRNRSQIPGKFYYKRKGKVGQGRISAPPRAVLMSPFSSENAVVLQPRTTRFSSWEGWRVEGMRVGVEVPAAASQAGVGFLLNLPTPSESPFSIESPAAPDSDRVLFVTPSFFH